MQTYCEERWSAAERHTGEPDFYVQLLRVFELVCGVRRLE